MAYNWFRPKPDAFGGNPVLLSSGIIAPAGVSSIVQSGTTTIMIPTPTRKLYVRRVSSQQNVVIVPGTSTANAGGVGVNLIKLNTGGTATTTISALFALASQTAFVSSAWALASGVTDGARLTAEGDLLAAQIISTTSITTQPTALAINVECLQIE